MAGDDMLSSNKASSRLFFDETPVGAAFTLILLQFGLSGITNVPFFGALFQKVIAIFLACGKAPTDVRIYSLNAVRSPRGIASAE